RGDFDKFYKQITNTGRLVLRNGVNPETVRQAFQKLMAENHEITGDSIQGIERKGNDVLLTLEVPESIDKGKVERQFLESYDNARLEDAKRIAFLEGKYEANNRYVHNFKDVIDALISNQSSNSIVKVINKAEAENNMSDNSRNFNIDQRHAINANAPVATGDNATQNIENNNATPEQKQSLAEAAAEIQQLLNQLSQSNPTTTSQEKMIVVSEVVDQIENNPTLKAKVINALKAGGVEAFKEALDHPLVNILVATIEGWGEA
ncbi:MAG: hypothetical protein F6K44_15995, partial [Moorea sp. SIO3E2]|nr:hypothetical protein [Moorena sp. SIO3E2]